MDPATIGAIVSGVSGLVGANMSNKAAANAARYNYAVQKEFAQHGVRWRVEDAKAAGLHPLYALQAQGLAQASPVAMASSAGETLAQAGQNVGQFLAGRATAEERMGRQLALKAAEQQLREGDARINLYNAEAALAHQQAMAAKGFPQVNAVEGLPGVEDARKINPATGLITPVAADLPGTDVNDPSLIAGDPAMWREFNIGDMRMVLPGGVTGDAAESLESVSESFPMMWMVFRENVKRFGARWAEDFLNSYAFQGAGDAYRGVAEPFFIRFGQWLRSQNRGWLNDAIDKVRDPMVPRGVR